MIAGRGDRPAAPGAPEAATASEPELAPPSRFLWPWVRQEVVLLLREPVAVFFSLAFPLVIYAFIGSAYADEEIEEGVRLIDLMFPALVGTVAVNLSIMGMPVYFAEIRSRGVLKRYATLPMPGWVFGVAVIGSLLVLFVLSALLLMAVVGITYHLRPGLFSFRFLGLMALLVTWVSAVGFYLGSMPTKVRTIQTVSAALFFLMFFGSGVAAPLDGLPSWLEITTRINPLRHWFDGLVDAYLGETSSWQLWLRMLAVLPVAAALVPLGLRNLRRETSD